MAYSYNSKKSGTVYYLHSKTTATRGGERTLYFFAKEQKEGVLDNLPEGYDVTESAATGLPLLKRKDKQ